MHHTQRLEVRAKISAALKAKGDLHWSKRPEVREKFRLAKLGKKRGPMSEETKRKIGEANKISKKGKKLSKKHRQKLSEAAKGIRPENNKKWIGAGHPNWKGGVSKEKGYHTPYSEAYRARKNNAVGSYSYLEWVALKKKYNNMCLCCKEKEPNIQLTADHIMPISKGGSNSIDNIQPLCRACNGRKWTKIINYIPLYEFKS